MTHVVKHALVPYSAEEMFKLVADIDRYQEFLPWCRNSSMQQRSENEVVGHVEVAKGPIQKTFSTANRLQPHQRIDLTLVDGPFKRLDGFWQFDALQESACKVTLDLTFEFTNRLLAGAFAPVFKEVAESMLAAFVKRAHEVYGRQAGR